MRHLNHRFQLGVKQEHRKALMANLMAQLFLNGKIKTTLAKAKALRPCSEKVITLAKDAANSQLPIEKLHYRRLAIARVHNEAAVKKLFEETVQQFLKRNGGYTRIYKLMNRVGDGAPMALIQLVEEAEVRRSSSKPKAKKTAESAKNAPKAAASGAEKTDEVAPKAEATAKKVAKKAEEPAKAE